MRNISALCVIVIMAAILVFRPEPPSDSSTDLNSVYPKEAYLQDIDELAARLIDNHPQPYEFITAEAFSALVDEKKRLISDKTTMGTFIWMYSAIISSIACSHTTLGFFNQEDRLLSVSLRFPLEARFIGSKLYVTDGLINGDVVSAGEEIVSINGISVDAVRDGIFEHIPTDGNSLGFKEKLANTYFTAYISYYFRFAGEYAIRTRTGEDIVLRPLMDYAYKPIVSPDDECQDTLCLRLLTDRETAVMTIRSSAYYGDNAEKFQAYVDSSFSAIASNRIKYLILDYRGNGGGSSLANAYLLRKFANRPFVFFDTGSSGAEELKREIRPSPSGFSGPVFILTDGFGLSSTGHFLSLVKAHGFATIIGEEAGATYTCNDNSKQFSASNTGIRYKIARNTFYTPVTGFPKNRGILPDHEIVPDIDAIVNNVDTVMAYTLDLIERDRLP